MRGRAQVTHLVTNPEEEKRAVLVSPPENSQQLLSRILGRGMEGANLHRVAEYYFYITHRIAALMLVRDAILLVYSTLQDVARGT
jgi:hypothetical protein